MAPDAPDRAVDVLKKHARQISVRSASTSATAESHIWDRLSCAICSNVAAAILARMPAHLDLQYPTIQYSEYVTPTSIKDRIVKELYMFSPTCLLRQISSTLSLFGLAE